MEPEALRKYVGTHLAHVFDQMLTSATTWAACHPDRGPFLPRDLVVMAEYSAFLHERCLYELACEPKGQKFRIAALGAKGALSTDLHARWYTRLNEAVLHIYARGNVAPPVRNGDHLKDQVASLACDVFSLFSGLETRVLLSAGPVLRSALDGAQTKSAEVAEPLGIPPIDWAASDPFVGWGDQKWWPVGDV